MEEKIHKFPNKRVCALLIDVMLLNLIIYPFSVSFGWDLIIFMFYYLIKDLLGGKRSIGKIIVGLKITDENGQSPSYKNLILRNVLFLIPLLGLIIEYFPMAYSKDGRRIGDKIAKTVVVDLRPKIHDSIFLLLSICIFIAYIFINQKLPAPK